MSAIWKYLNYVGCYRILIVFLALWLIILVICAFPMLNTNVSNSDINLSSRLSSALRDMEDLSKQNEELRQILKDISLKNLNEEQKEAIQNFQNRLTKAEEMYFKENIGYVGVKGEPNTQYELLRRRLYANTKEIWYFIHARLTDIHKKVAELAPEMVESIDYVLEMAQEHKRSLLYDLEKISEVDGYEAWREKEANDLSALVQERFRYLQNPKNCDKARKLICGLNKGCGYGCQLHHIVYCFMVAYGTKRTMILKSKGWRYHEGGWEEIFRPISETCTTPDGESISNWPGNEDTQVINLPIIDSLSPKPPFLPLSVPEDLAPRLIRLHGNPFVWWVGQILKYLLRPQEKTANMLQDTMIKMGFKRPIVGVHVRRTDKVGTEAAYHSLEEYMSHVSDYYDFLEMKQTVDKRRIYLASDDPKVFQEAVNKYPNYEIIGDPLISKTAAVKNRYTQASLFGIIFDIHMLSMSDYLVCTFSSQVCRVAYEIMQNYYVDASTKFKSLDDIYYYGGQNSHNVIALWPHKPKYNGEMTIEKGDLIGVAGNHWNGFSKGRNLRTNQIGLYPSFKVNEKVEVAKFPTYSESDKIDQKDE